MQRLKALRDLLFGERRTLIETIDRDFSVCSTNETLLAEIMSSLHDIHYATKRMKKWMKPARRAIDLQSRPASAQVVHQPLGVIGVIVSWDYPLLLSIGPLTGALAAGNWVMIKMSGSTSATRYLPRDLLVRIFPEDQAVTVLSGVDVGVASSKLPFGHLLFTGATSIGKRVIHAAAKNLTPTTLESGGKPSVITSDSIPIKDAAERIAFGKNLNVGQTCVAPDHVLVPSRRVEEFVSQYKGVVQSPLLCLSDNPDYTAIINKHQLGHLRGYLNDAREKGATLVSLFAEGQQRRLSQTLLLDVNDDMKAIREETFGSLLPVTPYERLEDALAYVNQCPRLLALYHFGYNKAQQQRMLHETHSDGVCLNGTPPYVAQDDIPFDSVGPSGMGRYHGHEDFLTLSKAKGVLSKPRSSAARAIYPPCGRSIQKLVYKLFVR